MKLSRKEWIVFICVAALCLGAWYKLSYPKLSLFDYRVDKKQAMQIAKQVLVDREEDPSSYRSSMIFRQDFWADRYLQRTLGARGEEAFLKEHDYELFAWSIRFFKEGEKEEYYVSLSPKTGEVLSFSHLIKDTEARDTKDKEVAKQLAKSFLKEKYKIDFSKYDFHEEEAVKKENRIDYQFSWEKKGVYVPWEDGDDAGGAKLIIGTVVSGEEIKNFYKSDLDIPEKFERYVEGQKVLGKYLSSIFQLVLYLWIGWSVFIIIRRRNDTYINRSWKWLIIIGSFLFTLSICYFFNDLQDLFFSYRTSSSMISYVGIYLIGFIINYLFLSVFFVMQAAAGESLHQETFPEKKFSSFFHYINTTLFSRSVAGSILFGYVLVIIFLGVQAVLFSLGQKYLGVWVERMRISDITTSYVPFLAAFIIGCRASLSEEIIYRVFGIHWSKKYIRNTILAVLVPAIVWGFSHTQYPIFPVWFRGIEVSIIGILYGWIFLRYGLIPLLVSHYLFDVFWGVSGFLLGNASAYLFSSSIFILALPLIFAAVAFFINKLPVEKDLEKTLSKNQQFNLSILVTYLLKRKEQGVSADEAKKELVLHNWDILLVEVAIKEVFFK